MNSYCDGMVYYSIRKLFKCKRLKLINKIYNFKIVTVEYWKAINVCKYLHNYLSAPAHDNILLIRLMWKGWGRILMWKASLPKCFTRYLFAQIRPASRASDESCSYSSDTRWIHNGNSSTPALLRPKSKIRIFESIKK